MTVLKQKVLLLDNSYCASGVIDVMRSILLVWKGSARIVEIDPDRVIRSQRTEHPVPSVIVLTKYVNVTKRRRESGKQRLRIFIRDKFRCQFCAKRFQASELTLDHIIPRSRGGADSSDNLATSCKACNSRKGNRTPDECRMPLLATPSALKYGLDKALLSYYAETRPEWRPYLFLDSKDKVA